MHTHARACSVTQGQAEEEEVEEEEEEGLLTNNE